MLAMRKKRKPTLGRQDTQEVPQTADRHKKKGTTIRLDVEVFKAIVAMSEEERRKVTQMLTILVEDAVRARGRWPFNDLPK